MLFYRIIHNLLPPSWSSKPTQESGGILNPLYMLPLLHMVFWDITLHLLPKWDVSTVTTKTTETSPCLGWLGLRSLAPDMLCFLAINGGSFSFIPSTFWMEVKDRIEVTLTPKAPIIPAETPTSVGVLLVTGAFRGHVGKVCYGNFGPPNSLTPLTYFELGPSALPVCTYVPLPSDSVGRKRKTGKKKNPCSGQCELLGLWML